MGQSCKGISDGIILLLVGGDDNMVVLKLGKSYSLKNLNVRWKESVTHQLKRKQLVKFPGYNSIDNILNNVEDTV